MIHVWGRLLKWFPNILTLSRILLACFLNFYIINYFGSLLVPTIIFILIFISDILDGKIARHYKTTSQFGALFDILADLFFVLFTYLVLYKFHIMPLWFFFIMLFKFTEFIITSFLLKHFENRDTIFVFDFLGRVSAVFFYIIPALLYITFYTSHFIYYINVNIFIFVTTFISIISSLYRLYNCVKVYKIKEKIKIYYRKYTLKILIIK